MNQTEKERCNQVNHDQALDQLAFDAAWTAFQNTPIDLVADSDDEKCRCVRNAILAYFKANNETP